MTSTLHDYLARDHERLDALLLQCREADDVPYDAYDSFRRGLVRHIGIEERLLFPVLRTLYGVTMLERQLHRDHAALAALLVPPPTRRELDQIVSVLETHNGLEERSGGLYELVERVAADRFPDLLQRVHAMPPVPVAPHVDSPIVRATITQLLNESLRGHVLLRDANPLSLAPPSSH